MALGKRKKKFSWAIPMVLTLVFALGWYICYLTAPIKTAGSVTVVVPQKSSTTDIAVLLVEKDLIKSPTMFKIYVKIKGFDGRLKAGEYSFSGHVSLKDIEEQLLRGRVVDETFTVPEGYTVEQTADLLESKGLVDREKFLAFAEEGDLKYDYLPDPGTEHRLEGFLFPDTYKIPKGYTEKQIIEMMVARFNQIYKEEWRKQAAKLDMTAREAVTLASIIEREAKVAKDRPLVSSVFHNRLERGMNLESCATVQFALGEVKEVLLLEDLKVKSPYNTYLHGGLPPGPIASPGAASLEAALFPAETDYLYFVAKKDGSHYFSKTLAEHNQAKQRYLK